MESLLLGFEELAPHYVIRLWKKNRIDAVAVDVEVTPEFWAARSIETLESLRSTIQHKAKEAIGFRMDFNLLDPSSLARSEGKSKRVDDKR